MAILPNRLVDGLQVRDSLFAAIPSHGIQKETLADSAFVLTMVAWQRGSNFENAVRASWLTPRSAKGAGMLSINRARTWPSDRPVRVVR